MKLEAQQAKTKSPQFQVDGGRTWARGEVKAEGSSRDLLSEFRAVLDKIAVAVGELEGESGFEEANSEALKSSKVEKSTPRNASENIRVRKGDVLGSEETRTAPEQATKLNTSEKETEKNERLDRVEDSSLQKSEVRAEDDGAEVEAQGEDEQDLSVTEEEVPVDTDAKELAVTLQNATDKLEDLVNDGELLLEEEGAQEKQSTPEDILLTEDEVLELTEEILPEHVEKLPTVEEDTSSSEELVEFFEREIKERLDGEESLLGKDSSEEQLEESFQQEALSDLLTNELDQGEGETPVQFSPQILAALMQQLNSTGGASGEDSLLNLSAQQGKSEAQVIPLFPNKESTVTLKEDGEATKSHTITKNQALRTMEKVENALKEVARSRDGKTISVRLDPPRLGKVNIDLTYREGVMHARIVAEAPAVTTLLRDKAPELQMLLRRIGLTASDVNVSVGNSFEGRQESSRGGSGQERKGGFQKEISISTLIEEIREELIAEDKDALTNEDYWIA